MILGINGHNVGTLGINGANLGINGAIKGPKVSRELTYEKFAPKWEFQLSF